LVLAAGGLVCWPLSLVAFIPALVLLRQGWGGRRLDPTNDIKGLEGERRVGEILASLEPDVLSVHDLDLGRGNVDHVAIAPSGVFAIETKHWRGRFARRRGELIHDEFDHPEARRQAMRSALAVHALLADAGIDVWVTPLLVSTRATVWKGGFSVGKVEVLPSSGLQERLLEPMRRLDPAQAVRIRAAQLRGGTPVSVRNVSFDQA
jgi:hypothetical protein